MGSPHKPSQALSSPLKPSQTPRICPVTTKTVGQVPCIPLVLGRISKEENVGDNHNTCIDNSTHSAESDRPPTRFADFTTAATENERCRGCSCSCPDAQSDN